MFLITPSVVRVARVVFVLWASAACIGCGEQEAIRVARKHRALLPAKGTPRSIRVHKDQAAADAVVPLLKDLPTIEAIRIDFVSLTAEQLEAIGAARDITFLSMQGCGIKDADLKHLSQLVHLRSIGLDRNPIEGPGLEYLAAMKELWRLDLDGTQIRGPGLQVIAKLPNLSELQLNGTKVDDAGVEHLIQPDSRVRSISLSKTRITQAGYLRFADLLWLSHLTGPDSLLGQTDDLKERLRNRAELKQRFREARLDAIERAKQEGREVPDLPKFP